MKIFNWFSKKKVSKPSVVSSPSVVDTFMNQLLRCNTPTPYPENVNIFKLHGFEYLVGSDVFAAASQYFSMIPKSEIGPVELFYPKKIMYGNIVIQHSISLYPDEMYLLGDK